MIRILIGNYCIQSWLVRIILLLKNWKGCIADQYHRRTIRGIKSERRWTTVISDSRKKTFSTWNSATVWLYFIFFLLSAPLYLITSGCCCSCTDTSSSGENPAIPGAAQQRYAQRGRASCHFSRQLSQSFSQGKAELLQFYCSRCSFWLKLSSIRGIHWQY